jgi:hypothetical protein
MDMTDANLTDADLADADLADADLTSADIDDADLTDGNLTDADVIGASLAGASLTGVTWSDATCPDGTNSDNDGGTCADNLLIPDASTDVLALPGPGDGQDTVSWTAPDNDVAADVIGYTVTAYNVSAPGTDGAGNTCTGTDPTDSCTVSGLAIGDTYDFFVMAFNENNAPGLVSSPSDFVMPAD